MKTEALSRIGLGKSFLSVFDTVYKLEFKKLPTF